MSTPRWYALAVTQIGITEIAGKANNPQVVRYQKATGLAASEDETPWCGSFIAWLMQQSGIAYNVKDAAWAKSWLDWGVALKEPVVGAVVVMQRGTDPATGHVTMFAGWTDDTKTAFNALGGNQSNMVKISVFSRVNVLGWRWPPGEPLDNASQPLHKSGVLHGAIVAGVGATGVITEAVGAIAQNQDIVVAGIHQAHTQYDSLGPILGLIAAAVVILGVGYVIYSRVKGKQDAKALSAPPAAS